MLCVLQGGAERFQPGDKRSGRQGADIRERAAKGIVRERAAAGLGAGLDGGRGAAGLGGGEAGGLAGAHAGGLDAEGSEGGAVGGEAAAGDEKVGEIPGNPFPKHTDRSIGNI